jgi:hypothetical protein
MTTDASPRDPGPDARRGGHGAQHMQETEVRPVQLADGRIRAVIERISPSVDDGRFPIKRVVGDQVQVEADCFADRKSVV